MNTPGYSIINQELLNWIENKQTTNEEIFDWFIKILDPSYAPFDYRGYRFEEFIEQLYSRKDIPKIRARLHIVAKNLFIIANWRDDDIIYLSRLLYTVGFFNLEMEKIKSTVLRLLDNELLKSRSINQNKSLHNYLLGVIEAIGYSPEMERYILRDIEEKKYAMICFNIFNKYKPDELPKALSILCDQFQQEKIDQVILRIIFDKLKKRYRRNFSEILNDAEVMVKTTGARDIIDNQRFRMKIEEEFEGKKEIECLDPQGYRLDDLSNLLEQDLSPNHKYKK